MKKVLPAIAFFSVSLCVVCLCVALESPAFAQNITGTTGGRVPQIAVAPDIQVIPKANITVVSPIGGETYVSGNRYPISWSANIPQVAGPYHLIGEIRLLDESHKEDLQIAKLNAQDLAKGTYQFLAGSQQDIKYGHRRIAQGVYKVWITIVGYRDCPANTVCAPIFQATATSSGPITLK